MTTHLRLAAGVRRLAAGRILMGGSPARVVRLSPAGGRTVTGWLDGRPLGAGVAERALADRLLDDGLVYAAPDVGRASLAEVALVVPVRDDAAGLDRLCRGPAELPQRIVVDDGSAVPVAGAAVRHPRPRGPAAARNSGWRRADTSLVAFLDSDTVPEPGWLETVLPLFDDPAVVAVAPRVRAVPDGPLGRFEAYRSVLDMGSAPATVRRDGAVRYVPAAALVVRRDALAAIGGFDEGLRFGEDVDAIWRLSALGRRVLYEPSAVVRHRSRPTVWRWLRQRFEYGTSAAALAHRHPGSLHPVLLSKWSLARWALAGRHPMASLTLTLAGCAWTVRGLRGRLRLRDAVAVVSCSQLGVAQQFAGALRRVWWPVAVLSPAGRRLLGAAYLVPVLAVLVRTQRPDFAVLRVLDDLAYGLGVWAGCVRHRTVEPLVPTGRRHR